MLLSLRKSFCRFPVDKKAFGPSRFIPFRDKSSTWSRVQLARWWSWSDLILFCFKNSATVSSERRSGAAVRCREEQSTVVPPFWCEQLHFTGHHEPVQQHTVHYYMSTWSRGWPKKWHSFFWYALTSSNINQFSKLFHCQNQEKMCNNTITKDFTTPQVCRYTCEMSSVFKTTIENKTTSVTTRFKEINKEQRVYCLSYCLK